VGLTVLESDKIPANHPNCLKCSHFKVSWDPLLPYSCTVFSLKSRLMPSLEVFRAVGANCPSFLTKEKLI
jgi:hypothetical protein